MPHVLGQIAKVEANGLRMPSQAFDEMRALQIRSGSRMWGYWVTSFRGDLHHVPDLSPDASGSRADMRMHQLVLSPIPPGRDGLAWLSSFEIEVLLKNRPGAIAAFLEVLRDNRVTIISNETTYVSYNQTRFQAYCQFTHAPALWEPLAEILRLLGQTDSGAGHGYSEWESVRRDHQIRTFRKSGMLMLGALAALEAEILTKDAVAREAMQRSAADPKGSKRPPRAAGVGAGPIDPGEPFLADPPVQLGSAPWFLSGMFGPGIESFCESASKVFELPDFLPMMPPEQLGERLGTWFEKASRQKFEDPYLSQLGDFRRFRVRPNQDPNEPDRELGPGECISTIRQEIDFQLLKFSGAQRDLVKSWWSRDLISRLHQAHWIKPVSCKALNMLAFSAVFRNHRLPAIEFTVGKNGLLELCPRPGEIIGGGSPPSMFDVVEAATKNIPKDQGFGPGTHALIAVSGSEGWARVRFIRPQWVEDFAAHVKIDYRVDRPADSSGSLVAPVGLLHAIAAAMRDASGNIESMHDHVTHQDPHSERGEIELVVFLDWGREGDREAAEYRRDPEAWRSKLRESLGTALQAYQIQFQALQSVPGGRESPTNFHPPDLEEIRRAVQPLSIYLQKVLGSQSSAG